MKFRQKTGKMRSLRNRDERDDGPINSVTEYKDRAKRHKIRKICWICGVTAGILLVIAVGKKTADQWKFEEYEIMTEIVREDTSATKFETFGENILKYGGDDVTLLNRQGETVWKVPHTMENPIADICQEACVIYDKNGNEMSVFNTEGKVGDIRTELPVLKARVAKQGVVAAILEDGETTWVNVYDAKGEELVTAKTRVDSPGYPVDLSISEDGLLLAVSYLGVEEHKTSSYVAFYNFGNVGQNQMDNMVSGYTYKDTLVPQVKYLGDSRAVAFRDDGFVVFQGKQIPEEKQTVKVKNEILSVFCDEEHIGLVFRNRNEKHPYRMELYNVNGKRQWSAGIEVAYDRVTISGDQILLYNDKEFEIFSMNGTCRYQGTFEEGKIRSLFKYARNRYLIVAEDGIKTIKLR